MPKGLENPDGKLESEGLAAKYQNSSKQRHRILTLQLDNVKMSHGQDPDVFLTQVHQLRDEVVHMGVAISDERLTEIVIEGLTDDYDQIKYNAEHDPDFAFPILKS